MPAGAALEHAPLTRTALYLQVPPPISGRRGRGAACGRTSISQARRSILYFTSRSAHALGALKLLLNTVLFRSSTSFASASFSCAAPQATLQASVFQLTACAMTAWKPLSQLAIILLPEEMHASLGRLP